MSEKGILKWVALACAISVAVFFTAHYMAGRETAGKAAVKAGFIFDGDESTPYSANFIRAVDEMKLKYGDRVSVSMMSNVPYEEVEGVLDSLAREGCDIIFLNSYGYGVTAKKAAAKYPEIEFCQATCDNANEEPVLSNYHTFMGEICEGRYIVGMVAGMKLQELLDAGKIKAEQALIGYVGAYPYAEVISGYTAFFLGARQTCPTAKMRVKYSNTWTGYALEKDLAGELIEEGCVIISQHSDTIGPAVMCEKAAVDHLVYHVGYNQDMTGVAPTTSLTGTRIDWSPYICAAVGAVLEDERIEDEVSANIHGNDAGAGFREGWVKMLELNPAIAPEGSREMIENAIEDMKDGRRHIFYGDYIGVNPQDPEDVWDLNTEYPENESASAPSFHYILKDVIVEE